MKRQNMNRWLKIIGAMLMLSCFALPMSSCTEHRDAGGHLVTERADGTYPADVHEVKVRHYLMEKVRSADPLSWLNIVAIVWPAIFVTHELYRRTSRFGKILWFTEPLLVAGSFYVIFIGALFEEFDVGTYVGWTGLAAYFLGWCMEAVSQWRAWMVKRRAINQVSVNA